MLQNNNLDFFTLLKTFQKDVVLLIGNGVNRYDQHGNTNSWSTLLLDLWNMYTNPPITEIPKNFSLPEFYNIMELRARRNGFNTINYQVEFCKRLLNWSPTSTHNRIVNWASMNNVPILTTNFDLNLSKALGCKPFRMKGGKLSQVYPWDIYFSMRELSNVDEGFGIWHLHGLLDYPQSLRLGLTHYLNLISRAKRFLKDIKSNPNLLYQNDYSWDGSKTWFKLFFTKPIIIFGLELDSTETFLRWLMIERWKFFLEYPRLEKNAWYVCPKKDANEAKTLFLWYVGINELRTENYDDIYLKPWKS